MTQRFQTKWAWSLIVWSTACLNVWFRRRIVNWPAIVDPSLALPGCWLPAPDNYSAEKAIRPVVLGQKNWLFAGVSKRHRHALFAGGNRQGQRDLSTSPPEIPLRKLPRSTAPWKTWGHYALARGQIPSPKPSQAPQKKNSCPYRTEVPPRKMRMPGRFRSTLIVERWLLMVSGHVAWVSTWRIRYAFFELFRDLLIRYLWSYLANIITKLIL